MDFTLYSLLYYLNHLHFAHFTFLVLIKAAVSSICEMYVKELTCSDKPSENYHETWSSPPCTIEHLIVIHLIVLVFRLQLYCLCSVSQS